MADLFQKLLDLVTGWEDRYITKRVQLAAELRQTLEAKNISKAEFAKLLGVSKQQVTKYLRGTNYTIETIAKWEDALKHDFLAVPRYMDKAREKARLAKLAEEFDTIHTGQVGIHRRKAFVATTVETSKLAA